MNAKPDYAEDYEAKFTKGKGPVIATPDKENIRWAKGLTGEAWTLTLPADTPLYSTAGKEGIFMSLTY